MGAEGALLHSPAAPAAAAERHTRQWAAANTSRSPPPSLPRAQCGQTADGPAVPRESSSLPSDGIGTCNGLIREQRAVIESSLCLPDLPSEPNPEQALLETGCQRSSALAHAIGRIRAALGLLPEPSRCRAPREGVLQPKARLLQQHPHLNTKVWRNSKRGRGGSLSPSPTEAVRGLFSSMVLEDPRQRGLRCKGGFSARRSRALPSGRLLLQRRLLCPQRAGPARRPSAAMGAPSHGSALGIGAREHAEPCSAGVAASPAAISGFFLLKQKVKQKVSPIKELKILFPCN